MKSHLKCRGMDVLSSVRGFKPSCRVLGEGVGDVQVPQEDTRSSWSLLPKHRRTLLLKGSTEEKKELNSMSGP